MDRPLRARAEDPRGLGQIVIYVVVAGQKDEATVGLQCGVNPVRTYAQCSSPTKEGTYQVQGLGAVFFEQMMIDAWKESDFRERMVFQKIGGVVSQSWEAMVLTP